MSGTHDWRTSAARAIRVTGAGRLARGIGAAGALMLALSWARVHVPPVVDRWLEKHPQHPSPDLVWFPPPPPDELVLGKTQPMAFTLILGVIVAASLAYFGIDALLSRFKHTRPVAWVLRAGLVVAALYQARHVSPFLGWVALGMIVPAALLFAGYAGKSDWAPRAPSRAGGTIILAAEALSLGWGIWLTLWPSLGVLSVLFLFTLVTAAGVRVGRHLREVEGQAAIERDAILGAPLLLLPLLGLKREPSFAWVAFVVAVCCALALAANRLERLPGADAWRARVYAFLRAVGGPWALGAMVLVPMRFREIGNINHWDHEGIHLGWVNSVTFGKFLMADASFVYGPLREYMLTAIAWLAGGITLEHVRESHFIENLTGFGFLLFAGWRVSRRRPWLHLWWAYVILAETQLALLIKYRDFISFGWIDVTRPAIACAALAGAIDTITAMPRGPMPRSPTGGPLVATFWRENRALILWGVLCGTATLYSQDYGPCAFGAVGLGIAGDSLLRRNAGPFGDRARRTLRLAAAWTLGVLAPIVLLVLVYACFGKAGLLIRRVTTWTGFLATAAWSGLRFPVGVDGYLSWATLAGKDDRGVLWVDYIIPPLSILLGGAVVTMAIVRRAWTARTTLLFALFAFAMTSFRHALIRSDVYHLRSDGNGAILLLFAMLCDLSDVRLRVRLGSRVRALRIGAVAVAALAFGWTYMEESWDPLRTKLRQLAIGEETPSQGPPNDNAGVPRAGDVIVPADIKALVKYVSETTTRRDPVLCTTGFMTGGELAFIIDRKNPIPFDVAHELTTREDQDESLRDLQREPPVLIVGDYLPLLGKPARDFIDAHWKKVNVPGFPQVVRRYDPSAPAPEVSAH